MDAPPGFSFWRLCSYGLYRLCKKIMTSTRVAATAWSVVTARSLAAVRAAVSALAAASRGAADANNGRAGPRRPPKVNHVRARFRRRRWLGLCGVCPLRGHTSSRAPPLIDAHAPCRLQEQQQQHGGGCIARQKHEQGTPINDNVRIGGWHASRPRPARWGRLAGTFARSG